MNTTEDMPVYFAYNDNDTNKIITIYEEKKKGKKERKKSIVIILNSFMLFCDVMRISSLFGYGDREIHLAKFIIKLLVYVSFVFVWFHVNVSVCFQ